MRAQILFTLCFLPGLAWAEDGKTDGGAQAAAKAAWVDELKPAAGNPAALEAKYVELVAQERAQLRTYDDHLLQLAALELAYGRLANPPRSVDIGAALDPERKAQEHWRSLLAPAATDKDTLTKKYKDLKSKEENRLASDPDHRFQLGTLDVAYKDMLAALVSPEHPAQGESASLWQNLHVAKSSAYSDRAKPAQFGWTRKSGSTVYSATGAIVFGYFGTNPAVSTSAYVWNWWGGFDFDVSSDTKKNPGKLNQTVAALGYRRNQGKFDETALHLTYLPSFTHEANRNFKTQSLVGQFLIEPAIRIANVPVNLRKRGIWFGPQIGVEIGEAIDKTKGKSPEDGGFNRLVMRWSFNAYPAGFGNKLYLYVDDTTRYLGDAHYKPFNLLNAGVSYELSDQVSLNADYLIGRDSPKFDFTSQLKLGLGLQF